MVVVNRVMELYQAGGDPRVRQPPDLHAAALAIDAVGCLVEGLGDRLQGDDAPTIRDTLNNIRLPMVGYFCQILKAYHLRAPCLWARFVADIEKNLAHRG